MARLTTAEQAKYKATITGNKVTIAPKTGVNAGRDVFASSYRTISKPTTKPQTTAPVINYVNKLLENKRKQEQEVVRQANTIATFSGDEVTVNSIQSAAPRTVDANLKIGSQIYLDTVSNKYTTNPKNGKPLSLVQSDNGQDIYITMDKGDPLIYNPGLLPYLNYLAEVTTPEWIEKNKTAGIIAGAQSLKENAVFNTNPDQKGAIGVPGGFQYGKNLLEVSPNGVSLNPGDNGRVLGPEEYEYLNIYKGLKSGEYVIHFEDLEGNIPPLLMGGKPGFLRHVQANTSDPVVGALSQASKVNPPINVGFTAISAFFGIMGDGVVAGVEGLVQGLKAVFSKEMTYADFRSWAAQRVDQVFKDNLVRGTEKTKLAINRLKAEATGEIEEEKPQGLFEHIMNLGGRETGWGFSKGADYSNVDPWKTTPGKITQSTATPSLPWEGAQESIDRKTASIAESNAAIDQAKILMDRIQTSPAGASPADLEEVKKLAKISVDIEERLGYSIDTLSPLSVNPWATWTFQLDDERYAAFKEACYGAVLHKLVYSLPGHLTEDDIKRLQDHFIDIPTEVVGGVAADLSNLSVIDDLAKTVTTLVKMPFKAATAAKEAKLILKATETVAKEWADAGKIVTKINQPAFADAIERALFELRPDNDKWLLRQSAKSTSQRYAANADYLLKKLGVGSPGAEDFGRRLDDLSAYVKASLNKAPNELDLLSKLPKTITVREQNIARELAKVIPTDKWSTLFGKAHSASFDKLFESTFKSMVSGWTAKNGKIIEEAPEDIVSMLKAQATEVVNGLLTPQMIGTVMADDFRKTFINNHRIFGAGSNLLDDGILGIIAKNSDNFKNTWLGKFVIGTVNVSNWVMGIWYNAVLSLRPAWVIRNMQDNVARFLIEGGKWNSSLDVIMKELSGMDPMELSQSMSRLSPADVNSIMFKVNAGERYSILNPFKFYGQQFKALYGKGSLPAFGIKGDDFGKKAISVISNVLEGADHYGGNFFRAFSRGTGDWNSFVEYSFRLRLYHTEYMKGIEVLRKNLTPELLKGISEDKRMAARALLERANYNPEKLAWISKQFEGTGVTRAIKGQENVSKNISLFASIIPDEVVGMLPDEALRPIRKNVEEFFESIRFNQGRTPTAAEVREHMAGIIEDVSTIGHEQNTVAANMMDAPLDLSARQTEGVAEEISKSIDEGPFPPNKSAKELGKKIDAGDASITREQMLKELDAHKVPHDGIDKDSPVASVREAYKKWIDKATKPKRTVGEVKTPRNNPTPKAVEFMRDDDLARMNSELDADFESYAPGSEKYKEVGDHWSDEYKVKINEARAVGYQFHQTLRTIPQEPSVISWAAERKVELTAALKRHLDTMTTMFPWPNATGAERRYLWAQFDRAKFYAAMATTEVYKKLTDILTSGKIPDNFSWIDEFYKPSGIEFRFDELDNLVEIKYTIPDSITGKLSKSITIEESPVVLEHYKSVLEIEKTPGMTDRQALDTLNGSSARDIKKYCGIPDQFKMNVDDVKVSSAQVLADPDIVKAYEEVPVGPDGFFEPGGFHKAVRQVVEKYKLDPQYLNNLSDSSISRALRFHSKAMPGKYPPFTSSSINNLNGTIDALAEAGYFSTPEGFASFVTDSINSMIESKFQKNVNNLMDKARQLHISAYEGMGMAEDEVAYWVAVEDFQAKEWARRTGKSVEEWWINEAAVLRGSVPDGMYMGNELYFDAMTGQPMWYSPLENAVKTGLTDKKYADGMAVLNRIKNLPGVKMDELETTGLVEWLGRMDGPVTPEQVLDHIKKNNVFMIEEVNFGNRTKFSNYVLGVGQPEDYFEFKFMVPGKPMYNNPHFDGHVVAHVRGTQVEVRDQLNRIINALHLEEFQSDVHEMARDVNKRTRWDLFNRYTEPVSLAPGTKRYIKTVDEAVDSVLPKYTSLFEPRGLAGLETKFANEIKEYAKYNPVPLASGKTQLKQYLQGIMEDANIDVSYWRDADEFVDDVIKTQNEIYHNLYEEVTKRDISDPDAMKWLKSQMDEDDLAIMEAKGYSDNLEKYISNVTLPKVISDWKSSIKRALNPSQELLDALETDRAPLQSFLDMVEGNKSADQELLNNIYSFREQLSKDRAILMKPTTVNGIITRTSEEVLEEIDNMIYELTLLDDAVRIEVRKFPTNKALLPLYPFSKNYQNMALNRMIKKAFDDGQEMITWTTGAQQVERYGNIKITWQKRGDNEWEVFMGGKHEGQDLGRSLGIVKSFEDVRALPGEIGSSWAETLWKKMKSDVGVEKTITRTIRPQELNIFDPYHGGQIDFYLSKEELMKLPGFDPSMIDETNQTMPNSIRLLQDPQTREYKAVYDVNKYKHRNGMGINSTALFNDLADAGLKEETTITNAIEGSYKPMEEGMNNYYDGEAVDFFNKIGKKFGIQVEDVKVPAPGFIKDRYKVSQGIENGNIAWFLYDSQTYTTSPLSYATREAAEKEIAQINLDDFQTNGTITVHGFKFNDEFTKWAGEPKPLFFKGAEEAKQAATIVAENGREVTVAYQSGKFNLVIAAHEKAHGLLKNLNANEWETVSDWMKTNGVEISGDTFNDLYVRRNLKQGAPLTEIEEKLYTQAQELFADGFVVALKDGFTGISDALRAVFEKIAGFLKRYYNEFIKGTVHEVEVPAEMRKVYAQLFEVAPKEPVKQVIKESEEMGAAWEAYKKAVGLDSWTNWDLSTPNTALDSASHMITTARFDDDILTAKETYNKLIDDLENLEHYINKAAGEPTKSTRRFAPIPDAMLPIEYQTWLKTRQNSLQELQKTQKALITWSDWLVDMMEKAEKGDVSAFFLQYQTDDFWKEISTWADSSAREMQKALDAVTHGGNYMGHEFKGALKVTNDAMLDYTFSRGWEEPMKMVVPFWMFPTRSALFWASTLAEHPEIAIWYQKYMLMSQRSVQQAGLVTSNGAPLPSYTGYIKIPGMNVWVNPLAPMSFRYVLNPLMGIESNKAVSYSGDEASATPFVSAVRSVTSVGQDFGFSINPFLLMFPAVSQAMGMGEQNNQTIAPLFDIFPMNWRRAFLTKLPLSLGKTDVVKDAIASEVPWKDSLIEVAALKDLNVKLLASESDPDKKLQLLNQYQEILNPPIKTDVFGNEYRDAREENPLWIKYRDQVEATQLYQKLIAYFVGSWGKVWTDADDLYNKIRDERNLNRAMINNNMGANIFDLDPLATNRYNQYIDSSYNTTEGKAFNLMQAIRRVTDENGKEFKDPQDRRDATAVRLSNEALNEDYYNQLKEYRTTMEEKLGSLPAGTSTVIIRQIQQEYYDKVEALDNSDMYKDRVTNEWSPINKPEDVIVDRYRSQWYRELNATLVKFDPTKESPAAYAQRKLEWEADLPKQAAMLAATYRVSIQEELKKLFPLSGLAAASTLDVPGADVANRIVDQLILESNPKDMTTFYRKNDTIHDALIQAWDALYWTPRLEALDGKSGDAYTKAANDFDYSHPVSGLTPEVLAGWVRSEPDYAGRWTEGELVKAYTGIDILDAEEHKASGKTEGELRVNQLQDIMSWADVGTERTDFYKEFEAVGGDPDVLTVMYFQDGGSELLALPVNSEKAEAALAAAKQAAANLGITPPTGAQLTLRIQAKDENELMKEKAQELLGATIFTDMAEYYNMSYADQKLYRTTNPEKYAAIKKYPDFKDQFGAMYPVWKMFYNPDDVTATSTGGSSGFGGSTSTGGSSTKKTSSGGLTISGASSIDLSYPLRDDYLKTGRRATMNVGQLLAGTRFGAGGTAGLPHWPQEMMDALGELMIQEFIKSLRGQGPLSQSAINYLAKMKINHPEWTQYLNEMQTMADSAQS